MYTRPTGPNTPPYAGILAGLLTGTLAAAGTIWLRARGRRIREESYDSGWLDGVTGKRPATRVES